MLSHLQIWIIFGSTLLFGEFFVLPGVGLLFAGLGSLSLCLLLCTPYGIYFDEEQRFLVFLGFSLLWFLILYYPLKKTTYFERRHKPERNIIGEEARIMSQDLHPGEIGKVKWSGQLANARLEDHIKEPVKVGTRMAISRVEENLLILKEGDDLPPEEY